MRHRNGYHGGMSHPVYVLLPADVEWSPVPGTTAQRPAPVRWYLRAEMPLASTQTAVLVTDDADIGAGMSAVAQRAAELGGIAIDGATQERIDAGAPA